jgi:hypothetical protein
LKEDHKGTISDAVEVFIGLIHHMDLFVRPNAPYCASPDRELHPVGRGAYLVTRDLPKFPCTPRRVFERWGGRTGAGGLRLRSQSATNT